MPLYEYQCPQCGRFELIRKFSDDPLETCPTCGNAVHKLLSAPAVHFKGTGWYITDYARKGSNGGGSTESKSEKSESKSEGKSEGKSEKSASKSDSKSSESSSSSTSSTPSTTSTGSDSK